MRISEVNRVVDEILDNFDFKKVQLCMWTLDWKWYESHVPSVEELRKAGRELLLSLCAETEPEAAASCGGFVAYKSRGEVHLAFELESCAVERKTEVL